MLKHRYMLIIAFIFVLTAILLSCSFSDNRSENGVSSSELQAALSGKPIGTGPFSSDLSDEELLSLLEEYSFDISELSSDESNALIIVRSWIKAVEEDPNTVFSYGLTSMSEFANRLKLYVKTE